MTFNPYLEDGMYSPDSVTATVDVEIQRLEEQLRALRGDDAEADLAALVAALRREQAHYVARRDAALEVGEELTPRPLFSDSDAPRLTGNELAARLQERIDAVDAEIVRLCKE